MLKAKFQAIAQKILSTNNIKKSSYFIPEIYELQNNFYNILNTSNILIESVGVSSNIIVSHDEVINRLNKGEILIVRECLQTLGLKKKIDEIALNCISKVLDIEAKKFIQENGFENFHKACLDLSDLVELYQVMSEATRSYSINLMSRIVYYILGEKDGFFAETQPNARLIIPFDLASKQDKGVKNSEKLVGRGKVTVHGPHQDSWFYHPLNTLNVWSAIGPVSSGNGLSIYPYFWGKRPKYNSERMIEPDQYIGPAINFDLKPGDTIIFKSEHIHGSEINQTNKTRFILSMRMTLEKPEFFEKHWYDYRQINFAQSSKMDLVIDKEPSDEYIASRKDESLPKIPPTDTDMSDDFPKYLQTKEKENSKTLTFQSQELLENEIKIISNSICVARINGKVQAFSRFCPHQAADLGLGYVKNQKVVCPWHNLCFDTNGTSSCKSFKSLRTFDCVEKENIIEVKIQ